MLKTEDNYLDITRNILKKSQTLYSIFSLIRKMFCSQQGFGTGARRLPNPQTPCRYIIAQVNESIYFLITLGTFLKSLFTNLLYIFWEPGAVGSETLVHRYKVFFFKNLNLPHPTQHLYDLRFVHACRTVNNKTDYLSD